MADATAPETGTDTTTETGTTEAETTDQTETDWKAEAEKWKSQSRKNEDRAKDNAKKAKDLDELHKASMTDAEKAIADAEARGRSAALVESGSKIVAAEVRAAAAGRNLDVDALLEGLDPARFLDSEGEPDADAISKWVDRIAPAQAEEVEAPGPLGAGIDLGQGTRTTDSNMALNGDPLFKALKSAVGSP